MTAAVLIASVSALGAQTNGSSGEVWGTVPAWVSAIGASLAFFLTFTLFLQGRRDRVREQAAMVYAIETVEKEQNDLLDVAATVYNKSTAPIWDVEVHPRWSNEGAVGRGPDQSRPFVEPEDQASEWTWRVSKLELAYRRRPPRVVFSDSAGRRWEKVGSDAVRQTWLRRSTRKAQQWWVARRPR